MKKPPTKKSPPGKNKATTSAPSKKAAPTKKAAPSKKAPAPTKKAPAPTKKAAGRGRTDESIVSPPSTFAALAPALKRVVPKGLPADVRAFYAARDGFTVRRPEQHVSATFVGLEAMFGGLTEGAFRAHRVVDEIEDAADDTTMFDRGDINLDLYESVNVVNLLLRLKLVVSCDGESGAFGIDFYGKGAPTLYYVDQPNAFPLSLTFDQFVAYVEKFGTLRWYYAFLPTTAQAAMNVDVVAELDRSLEGITGPDVDALKKRVAKLATATVAAQKKTESTQAKARAKRTAKGTRKQVEAKSLDDAAALTLSVVPRALEIAFQVPATTPPSFRALTHDTAFRRAIFTHDSARVVTCSETGLISVWDVATQHCLATLKGHEGKIHDLCLSVDGTGVVSGGQDGTIRIWALDGGTLERTINVDRAVTHVCSVADGILFATEEGAVHFLDAADKIGTKPLVSRDEQLAALAVSPDRQRALASDTGWLAVVDVASGKAQKPAGGQPAAAFLDDDRIVTIGDRVNVVDAESGKQLASFDVDRRLASYYGGACARLAVIPGTERVVTAGRYSLVVVDVAAQAIVAEVAWRPGLVVDRQRISVSAIAASPDGAWIASVWSDGAVALCRTNELVAHGAPQRHAYVPNGLAVTLDGRHAVTSGEDGRVRVWDTANTTNKILVDKTDAFPVYVTRDDNHALVLTGDELRAFDLTTHAPLGKPATIPGYWREFLRDGSMLVAVPNEPLQVWPVAPPGKPRTFSKPAGDISALAVAEAADLAVTGSTGGDEDNPQLIVKLWQLAKGTLRSTLTFHVAGSQDLGWPDVSSMAVIGEHLVIVSSQGLVLLSDLEGTVHEAFSLTENMNVELQIQVLSNNRVVVYGNPRASSKQVSPVVIDVAAGTVIGRCALGDRTRLVPVPDTALTIAADGDELSIIDFGALTRSAPTSVPGSDRIVATPHAVAVSPLAPAHVGAPLVLLRQR